ncbi:MAG TPA: DUF192 domain-containing protein [Quisquiliibacterium sp.]|nr:DUF192 domain-containing protein [Quisquiliibacterium sp.]HPA89545.1 DUF192 domain-containing protein [Quisquiliibacterium sp.]HQN12315.1 DUF192 domain-containing protein [Quisquiliibacterium sp.]
MSGGAPLTLERAVTFGARLVGLIGRSSLPRGRGLLLEPCDAIHTMAMRFPIDVVFLDRDGCIVRIDHDVRPWRMRICPGAHAVAELARGEALRLGLQCGSVLPALPDLTRRP